MNEMIQKTVLDSIDSIDDAQLFAEFDVLLAMGEVYAKAAMIQEASGLEFDGYSVIQEADAEGGGESKTGTKPAKKGGALQWIKTALGLIGKAIMWVLKKIATPFIWIYKKITTKKQKADAGYIQNLVASGNIEVDLTPEQQETLGFNSSTITAKNAKSAYKAKDRQERAYGKNKTDWSYSGETGSGTVPASELKIFFILDYSLGGLVKAYQKVDQAAALLDEVYQKLGMTGVVDQFNEAVKQARSYYEDATTKFRTRTREAFADCYKAYQEIVKYLNSADGRINAARKKIDDLGKSIGDDRYSPNSSEKVDVQIEKHNIIVREALAEMTKLFKEMTKNAEQFKKYYEPFLNTAENRAKVADALDEADADDRFGNNAEFPGRES